MIDDMKPKTSMTSGEQTLHRRTILKRVVSGALLVVVIVLLLVAYNHRSRAPQTPEEVMQALKAISVPASTDPEQSAHNFSTLDAIGPRGTIHTTPTKK
jgi:hypothetical protein